MSHIWDLWSKGLGSLPWLLCCITRISFLGPGLLHACSFPWQMSHGFVISSILGSPVQLRLHFDSITHSGFSRSLCMDSDPTTNSLSSADLRNLGTRLNVTLSLESFTPANPLPHECQVLLPAPGIAWGPFAMAVSVSVCCPWRNCFLGSYSRGKGSLQLYSQSEICSFK